MGSNRYSGWKSLGAMRPPLWLGKSHHMGFFLHFFAFLVTLLAVRTTVMFTLGTERTQTLVTHVGRWCGVIFALSRYLSGPGVVQKWVFWGSKSGLYGRLFLGWRSDLESVLRAISHPNAWRSIIYCH